MNRILTAAIFALMLAACASGTDHYKSASEAKAKLANDYNAGRFKDVIADADMLRKAGALDAMAQLVIGQAYFNAGDFPGCVRYAKTVNSNDARELQAGAPMKWARPHNPRSNCNSAEHALLAQSGHWTARRLTTAFDPKRTFFKSRFPYVL